MALPVIRWDKSLHEDVGVPDGQGLYEFVYQYLVYTFYAPSGSRVIIRRYTDEPARGSLFVQEAARETKAETFLLREKQFVAAVVAFMQGNEGVKQFDYFSGTYHQLDLRGLQTETSGFTFKRIADSH